MITDQAHRKVIANIVMSLDGCVSGSSEDGAAGMGFLLEHATSQESRIHSAGLWAASTTALLGRINYEGFGYYWPSVVDDPDADPLDRSFSAWLTQVEKVVFSRTLAGPTWGDNTRVSDDLVGEVARLRRSEGGDIVVLSSSTIIRSLLDAELLDELRISIVPEIVGVGRRLFDDGRPPSSWRLVDTTVFPTGTVGLHFARR